MEENGFIIRCSSCLVEGFLLTEIKEKESDRKTKEEMREKKESREIKMGEKQKGRGERMR